MPTRRLPFGDEGVSGSHDGPNSPLFAEYRWRRSGDDRRSPCVQRSAAAWPCGRIRLGTSSWSFPGWTGLVYAPRGTKPATEQVLARHGLAAYCGPSTASHREPRSDVLRSAHRGRVFPLRRAGSGRFSVRRESPGCLRPIRVIRKSGSGEAARDNPSFLDAAAAVSGVRADQPRRASGPNAGPLVFQFPPLGRRLLADLPRLTARIAAFMTMLPRGPLYAVEVRDPELAWPAFAAAVRRCPSRALPGRARPHATGRRAGRALRPRGRWRRDAAGRPLESAWWPRAMDEAKADYFPFNRLVEEDIPSPCCPCPRQAAQLPIATCSSRSTTKPKVRRPCRSIQLAAAIVAQGAD